MRLNTSATLPVKDSDRLTDWWKILIPRGREEGSRHSSVRRLLHRRSGGGGSLELDEVGSRKSKVVRLVLRDDVGEGDVAGRVVATVGFRRVGRVGKEGEDRVCRTSQQRFDWTSSEMRTCLFDIGAVSDGLFLRDGLDSAGGDRLGNGDGGEEGSEQSICLCIDDGGRGSSTPALARDRSRRLRRSCVQSAQSSSDTRKGD